MEWLTFCINYYFAEMLANYLQLIVSRVKEQLLWDLLVEAEDPKCEISIKSQSHHHINWSVDKVIKGLTPGYTLIPQPGNGNPSS